MSAAALLALLAAVAALAPGTHAFYTYDRKVAFDELRKCDTAAPVLQNSAWYTVATEFKYLTSDNSHAAEEETQKPKRKDPVYKAEVATFEKANVCLKRRADTIRKGKARIIASVARANAGLPPALKLADGTIEAYANSRVADAVPSALAALALALKRAANSPVRSINVAGLADNHVANPARITLLRYVNNDRSHLIFPRIEGMKDASDGSMRWFSFAGGQQNNNQNHHNLECRLTIDNPFSAHNKAAHAVFGDGAIGADHWFAWKSNEPQNIGISWFLLRELNPVAWCHGDPNAPALTARNTAQPAQGYWA